MPCSTLFMLLLLSADFFFSNKLFAKNSFSNCQHYQSVKQFGSRSGPTFCWAWSGSKLFAKVISRQQKSQLLTRNELSELKLPSIKLVPFCNKISFSKRSCLDAVLNSFHAFAVVCRLFFLKLAFCKKFFQQLSTLSECQTVWIQIRPNILLGLIWVQTVWEGYKQTTKVTAISKEWIKWAKITFYQACTFLQQDKLFQKILFGCRAQLFSCFCCCLQTFFLKLAFCKKFFQQLSTLSECQTVWIQIRPTFCWTWSGSKLFAKVISRQQKSQLARNELSELKLPSIKLVPFCNKISFSKRSCLDVVLCFYRGL